MKPANGVRVKPEDLAPPLVAGMLAGEMPWPEDADAPPAASGPIWFDGATEAPTEPDGLDLGGHPAEAPDGPTAPKHEPLVFCRPTRWLEMPPPPVKWLLDGLIPAGAPTILAGKPNCGKSMLAMQISMAVAAGCGQFGRQGPAGPVPVLFVQMEDSEVEVHRRFLRCLTLLREDPIWTPSAEAALLGNWRPGFPNWDVASAKTLPALVPWLVAESEDAGGGGLIVLDTLAALSEGEENSAESHRAFWSAAYKLAAQTGATPLITHHVRKTVGSARQSTPLADRLAFDALRGSTAIVAGARAILQVEPLTSEEATKGGLEEGRAAAGNFVVLGPSKQASGPKGEWLALEQRQADEPGAGFFVPLPGGERVLAALRSKAAAAELSRAEFILVDVASGLRHGDLAAKHFPNDPQAELKLKRTLTDMRRRHRWLVKGGLELTVTGFEKARALQGRQAIQPANPAGGRNEQLREFA